MTLGGEAGFSTFFLDGGSHFDLTSGLRSICTIRCPVRILEVNSWLIPFFVTNGIKYGIV